MVSSSGTQCYHCGKLRLAKCCPHCRYYEINDGEMTVCQRCGGVFRHSRCFQCAWSGEPVAKAERPERGRERAVLGMFELHKMEQRLARKAVALGIGAQLEGPVADAVDHAFAEAHEAPLQTASWTSSFELMATSYLESLAQESDEVDLCGAGKYAPHSAPGHAP